MLIDTTGVQLSTLSDILDAYQLQLQSKYGADFYIKPEGIIDNLATSAGFQEMSLQDQIAFLAKQFDPESAEGVWQDKLYERINVYRLQAEPSVFIKGILGTAGYSGEAGSITIRNTSTGDEFVNTSAYIIENTGSVNIEFECVITGATLVNETDSFQIVEAPDAVTGISTDNASNIALGRDRETDDEYRIRYRTSKAVNAKASRIANESNLLKYVDNIAFLKIIDKKTDSTYEAGTLRIIAKHNVTDQTFAEAIFDTVADGIDLLGDNSATVTDNAGQSVTINWQNAENVLIDITGIITIRDGYYSNTVFANAKQNILDYIQKRVFGLQSIIYATEFIIPIYQTEGVDAVISVQIKKHTEDSYVDSITLELDQVPEFTLENITLTEQE